MNIGFYLLDIDISNSYHNTILQTMRDLCKLLPYEEIVLFDNQSKVIHENTGYYVLHINEAKYFKGTLFVFDAKSLALTRHFPAPKKQIFVMNQADWTLNRTTPYNVWESIYMNDNVDLVTTNSDLNTLCKICWKDPISDINELNGATLRDVLQKI